MAKITLNNVKMKGAYQLFKAHNMTWRQLAEQLNTSKPTVIRWLKTGKLPTHKERQLAEYFKVERSFLYKPLLEGSEEIEF